MPQRPIMKYREIEPAAVPRHKFGCVFVNAVKEAADDLRFIGIPIPKCPDTEPIAASKRDGDSHHPVQVEREEVGTGLLLPEKTHRGTDVLIGQTIQPEQLAP